MRPDKPPAGTFPLCVFFFVFFFDFFFFLSFYPEVKTTEGRGGASFFPPSTCSAPILWLPGNRAGEGRVILRSGRGHMTQGAGPRHEEEVGGGPHEAKHRPSEDSEAAAAVHY